MDASGWCASHQYSLHRPRHPTALTPSTLCDRSVMLSRLRAAKLEVAASFRQIFRHFRVRHTIQRHQRIRGPVKDAVLHVPLALECGCEQLPEGLVVGLLVEPERPHNPQILRKLRRSTLRPQTTDLISSGAAHARGGGGGAKRVCRLLLPGARTCAPFEEGTIYLCTGGLVAHPLVRVKRVGSGKLRQVGSQLGSLPPWGNVIFTALPARMGRKIKLTSHITSHLSVTPFQRGCH